MSAARYCRRRIRLLLRSARQVRTLAYAALNAAPPELRTELAARHRAACELVDRLERESLPAANRLIDTQEAPHAS